jgi:prolipoprotein diacylglyceryltransferase
VKIELLAALIWAALCAVLFAGVALMLVEAGDPAWLVRTRAAGMAIVGGVVGLIHAACVLGKKGGG